VRVYAGIDPVTKKRHDLLVTVSAGPKARREAERIRDRFLHELAEKRNPRTSATVDQLLAAISTSCASDSLGVPPELSSSHGPSLDATPGWPREITAAGCGWTASLTICSTSTPAAPSARRPRSDDVGIVDPPMAEHVPDHRGGACPGEYGPARADSG
jgi:hypothetical protein